MAFGSPGFMGNTKFRQTFRVEGYGLQLGKPGTQRDMCSQFKGHPGILEISEPC